MRLTVLGCSGSMAGPDSAASSYLVRAGAGEDDTVVALDLGSGAFGPLMAQTSPTALDAVVLSHLHPDHCADLTAMAVWRRYGPDGALPPLRVIGPEGTRERLAVLCEMEAPEISEVFAVEHLTEGQEVRIGALRLQAHPVRHPIPAWGLRVSGPSDVHDGAAHLGYTGDTAWCEGAIAVGRGVDLLLAEAAFQDGLEHPPGIHLTGAEAGQVATRAGARRLVLTHLQPWTDAARVLAGARGAYSGPVEVTHAGADYLL
ncbi:MBL fold metallo-hydrolase [Serinibacter salmoneus]|uniref:Ribonuclease BN (tRNA processing enzyme) n=1 Tax=Serinibacter salmoneus TaxID=556530 RepID=A0A2A9D156_9MICO|nr:MBL fold metallo-hydrolase [Serinibacter salmoneus]PFG19995.1 ribonuclease BN (tRNA processing enzyme) [Serinibacter salmoneus]